MADNSEMIGQNEIETLLNQAKGPASAPPASHDSPNKGSTSIGSSGDDIQLLLEQAEQAIASVNDPNPSPADIQAFQFRDLAGSAPSNEKATIDLLRDVELDLKIELGRTHMELEELLKLRRGSVVSLDKLAGDPVDVYVNGRLIARGEVLVLNDNFCVRVAELISGDD
ncbi:MAG TPA: flagellar motor switch protein FliN [Pirellulaceae bacterium]|nr:flagellar motor switch protein FliN [Pirellulaceae bacterium]